MVKTNISLAFLLVLSACSAGTGNIPAANMSASRPVAGQAAQPRVVRGDGIDSIIGQNAAALLSRFGKARIDLTEGDARKLQFASAACVMDIYLYPTSTNAQPVATHIEAREPSAGGPVEPVTCLSELEQ